MKVKILVSMSSATDGSHGLLQGGEEVELDDKTAKYLVSIGNAMYIDKPAVKVTATPDKSKAKVAVKKE